MKFSQFRRYIEEVAAPRAPADQDFWNKHLVLNYKLSEPTKDDAVFKATNVAFKAGLRPADASNSDDQSQGYHRPVIFGDYLNYLLNMPEGYEHSDEELAILEDVSDMDADLLEEVLESEVVVDVLDEEVEQVDELSQGTLKSYRSKAAVSYVKHSHAADKAHDAYRDSSIKYQMSKKRNPRETEDDHDERQYHAAMERDADRDEAEYHYKKADNRKKGVDLANKKIKESFDRVVEEMLAKKKRGRPKKVESNDDEESGAEPILVQLRKHELARGQRKIQFDNGEHVDVHPAHVKKALDMHVNMRTSIEKGDFQKKLAHSHASFKAAVGAK